MQLFLLYTSSHVYPPNCVKALRRYERDRYHATMKKSFMCTFLKVFTLKIQEHRSFETSHDNH